MAVAGSGAAIGQQPLVSVVMPAYNAAAFVAEAIGSVLAQSLANLELIVIDDASSDATAAIVAGFDDPRIVLIRLERNGGAAAARNAGIAKARGEFIALLDADDLAQPTRLAEQVDLLRRSGADVCASRYLNWNVVTDQRRHGFQYERDADLRALLAVYSPIGNSTVTGTAAAFRSVPYEAEFTLAEDYRFWTRLAAQGLRFVASPHPLTTYRVHPAQVSVVRREKVEALSIEVRRDYLSRLGIDERYAPRRMPWRERLRVAPQLLRQLHRLFGPVSVRANREIYSRFQYRGNGALTPFVRLERWLAALWGRFGT